MEYRYSPKANYEDLASGRVLYHARNIANFPVRLQAEIFCRAKQYLSKQTGLTVYDPCCGGGGSLVTLGFLFNHEIDRLIGSDIDPEMAVCAAKNLSLLSKNGLAGRKKELEQFYRQYHKESHLGAIESAGRLEKLLVHTIETKVLSADCTQPLPDIKPDIVITDVPYGNLAEWYDMESYSMESHTMESYSMESHTMESHTIESHTTESQTTESHPMESYSMESSSMEAMLERLYEIAGEQTVLAVCMDKKQKFCCPKWRRLERENIGKRKFEILKKN